MKIWDCIEGFNREEKWGDPEKLNGLTLMLLSAVRKSVRYYDPNAYIVVHAGYATDGHTSKSQHYKGNAVDFHIVTDIPYDILIGYMLAIFKELQVQDKIGFGIYPDWNSPGFHLDTRGELARWGYIDNIIYFGLDGFSKVYEYTTAKFKNKEIQ